MNRFGNIGKNLIVRDSKSTTLDAHSCGFHQLNQCPHDVNRPFGRKDYQLIYMTKGAGYFMINDQNIKVSAGNIIVYPPGTPQVYRYLKEADTAYYWLHFIGASNHMELAPLFENGPKIISIGHNDFICNALEGIIAELIAKGDYYPQISNQYLYTLLLTILRYENASAKPYTAIEAAIQETANYMRQNYAKKYTLQDYAAYNNLSISRFIHNFEAIFSLAPMKYLSKIRLEKASWLLLNTILPISDIALSVGYDDPLYFSRVFKKEHHVTPSAYRKVNALE